MMNVLYIITTFEKGIGGHYISLKELVSGLGDKINPHIVNIGRCESPVLMSMECTNFNFIYKYYNFLWIRNELIRIANRLDIDVIHCFDDRAYLFVRSKVFSKYRVVVTKCGGKLPVFYPKIKNLILYSNDDYRRFRKCRYERIDLIPNRVLEFDDSNKKIQKIKTERNISDSDIVLLRIARISRYYMHSFMQSMNLVKDLNRKKGVHHRVKLIVVGQVLDKDVFIELKNFSSEDVVFLTEEYYYKNARELIMLCDAYIGTGRGLMEAASKKKVLLCPVQNKRYPCLLSADVFESFFSSNFSERCTVNKSDNALFDEICDLLSSVKNVEGLKEYSFYLYKKFFSLESRVDWYVEYYNKISGGVNRGYLDILMQGVFFHYYYFSQRNV